MCTKCSHADMYSQPVTSRGLSRFFSHTREISDPEHRRGLHLAALVLHPHLAYCRAADCWQCLNAS